MTPIATLLRIALVGGTLDADAQKLIVDWARRHANNDLIVTLLKRDDIELDAELDAELGTIDAPVVRSAWIKHHRSDSDAVSDAVKTEKRSTVLTALADVDGLPDAVYLTALGASPSISHVVAYIASERVSDTVRVAAVETLCARDNKDISYAQASSIRAAAKTSPAIRRAGLLSTGRDELTRTFLEHVETGEFSTDELESIAERYCLEPLRTLIDRLGGREPTHIEIRGLYTIVGDCGKLNSMFLEPADIVADVNALIATKDLNQSARKQLTDMTSDWYHNGHTVTELREVLDRGGDPCDALIAELAGNVGRATSAEKQLMCHAVRAGLTTAEQYTAMAAIQGAIRDALPETQRQEPAYAAGMYLAGAGFEAITASSDPLETIRIAIGIANRGQAADQLYCTAIEQVPELIGTIPLNAVSSQYGHAQHTIGTAMFTYLHDRLGPAVGSKLCEELSVNFNGTLDEFIDLICAIG